jgi:hypothetical protein
MRDNITPDVAACPHEVKYILRYQSPDWYIKFLTLYTSPVAEFGKKK